MSENTQRDYIPMSVEENDPIKLEVDVARIIRGISPTVETERLENGARITITDLDGEHVAEIYDVTAENAERAAAAQEAAEGYAESAGQSATNAAASESNAATSEANAATSESNAADSASSASESAATAVSSAAAAVNANAAIQGMGVNSTTLEPGSQATVTKIVDPVTGAITLSFGLPKGEKGDAGMVVHICSSSEYDSQTRIPTIQNPDTNTFYLVPAESGSSPDLFVEWIYTNNAWEMFGSATIEIPVQDVQIKGSSIVTDGIANIPVASSSLGVVKVDNEYGITAVSSGRISTVRASANHIKAGENKYMLIVPFNQHESIYYGLSKAAGVDLANETVTVGTYTDDAKSAIQQMLGVPSADDIPDVPVQDVQINGTSILDNGVANVPIASANDFGAVKIYDSLGIGIMPGFGYLTILASSGDNVKNGSNTSKPIVPFRQHEAAFFGLAKAAGADMKDISSTTIGVYPDAQKTAIRTMLGATSDQIVAVQDETPTDPDTKLWINETPASTVQVPTVAEMNTALSGKVGDVQVNGTSVVSNGVANVPMATYSTLGAVKIYQYQGLQVGNDGGVGINSASDSLVKAGAVNNYPSTPGRQHLATFFGLSKAAGVDLANETVTVGTYPETSKTAIRGMLGAVGDVQVNGTSVVTDGVANVPLATDDQYGLVKPRGNSFVFGGGFLQISFADSSTIKSGNSVWKPVNISLQHESTFFGLAKAAGDTTQSASSNAVGTYTDAAKLAIQQMLGIDLSSIASQVEIPLVETVTGTVVNITGYPNTRYVCGEVVTIDVTPPASGSIDVLFESGSTAAVLTVPNTVKWPSWFDATSLDTDTTYEILITDGVYGSVMSWAT